MFSSGNSKTVFFRKFWSGTIPYTLVLFFIFNFVISFWHNALVAERQGNLLLNTKKSDPAGLSEIRYDLSVGEDTLNYLKYIPDATKNNLVVITGMSQMYAINEYQAGDQTISEWMDDYLRPRGARVFGMAAPNITNEETLLLLLSLMNEPNTRPKIFIYGLCFDKFRNIGLRPEYQRFLSQKKGLAKVWETTISEFEKKYPLASQKMKITFDSLPKEDEKREIENSLRSFASGCLPVIRNIKDINALVQLKLFSFRNWIFGIKPDSKRLIIEGRYEMNQQFLSLLADLAAANNIKLIFYIVPLNPRADNPYLPEEYKRFKSWLGDLCQRRNIAFGNFESVVPTEHWGSFMGGPDFKHFKGTGHKITSEAILREFKSIFDKI